MTLALNLTLTLTLTLTRTRTRTRTRTLTRTLTLTLSKSFKKAKGSGRKLTEEHEYPRRVPKQERRALLVAALKAQWVTYRRDHAHYGCTMAVLLYFTMAVLLYFTMAVLLYLPWLRYRRDVQAYEP